MKSVFGLLLCGIASTTLWARPAAPNVPSTVENDGDTISVLQFGDEHYHYATSEDGFLILSDKSGRYVYADSNGKPSNVPVRSLKHRTSQEKKFLEQLGESGKNRGFLKHKERAVDRFPDEENQPGALILKKDRPALRPSAQKWVSGVRHIPVLLIGTEDIPHADSAAIHDLLNKEGYNKDNNIGSLRDYYLYSSGGKLDINFDVYPLPLGVPQTSFGMGDDFNEGNYIKTGLNALAARPDFLENAPKYCAQGNKVDGFLFLFPGEEANALKQSSSFWAHKYQMIYNGSVSAWSSGYTVAGYTFDSYLFIGQYRDGSNNRTLNAMGIFAHEFSHVLGLHDLYASSNGVTLNGPTPYDVMTQGMYNGNWNVPPAFSAFERESMGWLTPTELKKDSIYTLKDLSRMEAYSISNPNQPDEYYIVEYRPAVKYDAYIRKNGVYMWYIDYDEKTFFSGAANATASHQRVAMKSVLNKGAYYTDFTFINKNGVSSIPGVYNFVLENDTLACFTTNPSTQLTQCPVEQISSSSVSSISSSSEAASSSSALPESSSATVNLHVAATSPIQVKAFGSTLQVISHENGPKRIVIFDLMGNKLLATGFSSGNFSVDLKKLGHKIFVVQIFENGKSVFRNQVRQP